MRTLILIVALIALGLATLGAQSTSAAQPVSVVYFYPKDQTPNYANINLIDSTVEEMQGWYGALVGSTFAANPVQVIQGARTLAKYQTDPWGLILRELGYYCGTGVHLVILHESIAPGYGGGGSCSGDGGGLALVTESWLGHGVVPHELGHAFTLPHPDCNIYDCSATVMWGWWNYPNVGLLDYEISTLQGHPAFSELNGPKSCTPKYNPHGKLVGPKRCR